MHRTTRRTPLFCAAVALAAAVPVAGPALANGATARTASTTTVVLKHTAFTPRKVTIARGGTVRWVWRDGATPHNVTGKGYHSRTITKGSFSHRFTRAGRFTYRCTIHPGMNGTVVVR
jgi:plastocyanin